MFRCTWVRTTFIGSKNTGSYQSIGTRYWKIRGALGSNVFYTNSSYENTCPRRYGRAEKNGRSIICAAVSFDEIKKLGEFLIQYCCVDTKVNYND